MQTFFYFKKRKKEKEKNDNKDSNAFTNLEIIKRYGITSTLVGALVVPKHLVCDICTVLRYLNWLKHGRNNICCYKGFLPEVKKTSQSSTSSKIRPTFNQSWMSIHLSTNGVVQLNMLSTPEIEYDIKNVPYKIRKDDKKKEKLTSKHLERLNNIATTLKDRHKSKRKKWKEIKQKENLMVQCKDILIGLLQDKCVRWSPNLRPGSALCLGKVGIYNSHKSAVQKIGYCQSHIKSNIPLADINHTRNSLCPRFRYIELFSGIGGFRVAFDALGGRCIFASEKNLEACATYDSNFNECPIGDITHVEAKDVPLHDILTAGFPCQSFSLCGNQNGMGDKRGLGNLFWEIIRIAYQQRPRAILLENVVNLIYVNKGQDFRIILQSLEAIGYQVHYAVIDSLTLLPQQRRRLYIVGFQRDMETSKWPEFYWPKLGAKIGPDIFTDNDFTTITKTSLTIRHILETPNRVSLKKYGLNDKKWKKLKELHGKKINVFLFILMDMHLRLCRVTVTIGQIIVNLYQFHQKNINARFFTPRECARLQGFPDNFKINNNHDEETFYRQIGNAVNPPVVQAIAECILKALKL